MRGIMNAARRIVRAWRWLRSMWTAQEGSHQADMEWQMIRILLIFRLIHAVQISLTVPAVAPMIEQRGPAILVLALVGGESAWFVLQVFRHRGYGPALTAYVELGCAVVVLLSCAVLFPTGDRSDLAAPLLIITTEQVSGVGVASALRVPVRVLVYGTAAVAGSYATLIGTGSPSALFQSDVIIG